MTDKKTIDFWTTWKLPWSDITIDGPTPLNKPFLISYNNVVFHWKMQLSLKKVMFNSDRIFAWWFSGDTNLGHLNFDFSLLYEDGPCRIMKIGTMLQLVSPGQSWSMTNLVNQEINRDQAPSIWKNCKYRDLESIRSSYRLDFDHLIFRIWLKVPMAAFSFNIPNPLPIHLPPDWIAGLFSEIENESSLHWNAKFVSNQKKIFYVDKAICRQSTILEETVFTPPGHGNPPDEYTFPNLDTTCLRSLIEYLYKGHTNLESLLPKKDSNQQLPGVAGIMNLADTSSQYNLEPLSKACCAILWRCVVDMPELASHIARYASQATHDDMKYLKDRAMDILAENFKKLFIQPANMIEEFGGGNEGKLLLGQFCLFLSERVEPF